MAGEKKRTKVKEIWFDDGMHILFKDGAHLLYSYYDLRCSCPCAGCIDELTGEKILDDQQVDPDVHPKQSEYVGNYAIRFVWSDQHDSGIYPFKDLRDKFAHQVLKEGLA